MRSLCFFAFDLMQGSRVPLSENLPIIYVARSQGDAQKSRRKKEGVRFFENTDVCNVHKCARFHLVKNTSRQRKVRQNTCFRRKTAIAKKARKYYTTYSKGGRMCTTTTKKGEEI